MDNFIYTNILIHSILITFYIFAALQIKSDDSNLITLIIFIFLSHIIATAFKFTLVIVDPGIVRKYVPGY
jgi:hypothetical protein